MDNPGERWLQSLELDWAETKDKWRSKIKRELRNVENTVLESTAFRKLVVDLGELGADDASAAGANADERDSAQAEGNWLLGGKLAPLGLCEESDEQLGLAKRERIGFLKVRVKSLVCEDASKAWFELSVEGETIQSPIAFQTAGTIFVWELEARLPVTDIAGSFSIRVFSSSALSAKDKCIGTLVVPFFALLDRGARQSRTAVYALLPPPTPASSATYKLGVPGHRKALGTGLDKEAYDGSLHLTVRHELDIFGPKRILWPLYLANRRYIPAHRSRRRDAGADDRVRALSLPQELLASVNDIKRNAARIETSLLEMLSSLPVVLLFHLRSWDQPLLSGGVCALALAAARWLPQWAAPLLLYALLTAMCILSKKVHHENYNWVIFNQDIDQDPDQGLSTVVRLARVARKFDQAAQAADIGATLLEKAVNAWNFSDPLATSVMLMLLFLVCVVWAAALHFCTLLGLSFYGPALVFLLVVPLPSGSRRLDHLRAAALALFDRLPSHDDLGTAWLARRQTVAVLD